MITKRYNTFTALRWEYWVVLILLIGFSDMIDATIGPDIVGLTSNQYLLGALLQFAMLSGMLAVTAARCRDAGLNGWWTLASFIPLATIYFGCIRNDDHPKKTRAFEKLRANDKGALFK